MITIFNTGGTFNKVYDELSGNLSIYDNNFIVKQIIDTSFKNNKKPEIKGIIYKDSLELTKKDRKTLVKKIKDIKSEKIVIIHGTDTMSKSAKFIAKKIKNKTIVFVGAMKPFSIEPVEATSNLMMALGFLKQKQNKHKVYICMHGLIKKYNKIKKNKEIGVFKCQ